MFFTEKRYRSINIDCTKKIHNTIPPPGLFNIGFEVLNSEFRSSVKGHYRAALSCTHQINILLFLPKGIQNLLTIPNSRLLLSLSPPFFSRRSLNCLPDQSSSLISRPFRIERILALTCLNTQITLQYKPHKRATKLILTILTDIKACNNNISNNNKREVRITSRLGG